jgi:hypothetical protein
VLAVRDVETVNAALKELASRLVIPCDIIAVHRLDRRLGRPKVFQSLRYGAFLLTFAPIEGFFDNITSYRSRTNRTLGFSTDRVRGAINDVYGESNITRSWAARIRLAEGGRSPWALLKGKPLADYVDDMKSLRDLLSHGGDPRRVTNKAGAFYTLQSGHSIHLATVEGFIQAVEDIASQTALTLFGADICLPVWPLPPLTTAGTRPARPY